MLILGGGDGGILHEILKLNVKRVVMLELDEDVMDSARKHLRKICGDTLDSYVDDRKEVCSVGCDCLSHLVHVVIGFIAHLRHVMSCRVV